tara:strand:+ start:866 stop:1201 length:336 start_codon:yes stop_codon:yes gene_type:complete
MITSEGLKELGFVPEKDFVLQDDGNGTYIKDWISSEQRPTVADIEVAHAAWVSNHDAQEYARKRREAYDAAGCTMQALTIATFESVFADDSAAAVQLQIEREKIKAAIPKP